MRPVVVQIAYRGCSFISILSLPYSLSSCNLNSVFEIHNSAHSLSTISLFQEVFQYLVVSSALSNQVQVWLDARFGGKTMRNYFKYSYPISILAAAAAACLVMRLRRDKISVPASDRETVFPVFILLIQAL